MKIFSSTGFDAKTRCGRAATKVAQSCTLLYRRFVIGGKSEQVELVARENDSQNAILRYSRLKICATENPARTKRCHGIALQRCEAANQAERGCPSRSGLIAEKTSKVHASLARRGLLRLGQPRSDCTFVPLRPCVQRQQAVALIVTLLMLSVITFMTVTFLYLARSEKGSVVTATEQSTARYAADAAMERAKAEILGPILAFNNDQRYDLMVSTNFINGAGFQSGLSSFENVSYNYANGAPLSTADLEQNLVNLLYDPRPPVVVITNRSTGSNEFRYYLDLNRNGRDDPSGLLPVIGRNGGFLHPNGSEDLSPVNVVSNFVVGDPEWIGVLEHPDQPHSSSNRFVARYAYLVVPAGKTLDINYNHNQAQDIQNGNRTIASATPDGYLRNQGVGSWEINLAAFLADLNTNVWYKDNGQFPNYYQYTINPLNAPPFAFSSGIAFADARSLLAYRYANNYNNLQNVFNLFGTNGATAISSDNIDEYDDGFLQVGTALPLDNEQKETVFPWVGADNPNHFFTSQELFDPTKTAIGVSLGVTNFTDRLLSAGSGFSSYDRYTFYRMLAQLGTDSAPESGKININYLNVDANGNVVPGMETNFISWNDPRIPLLAPNGFGYGRPGPELFFLSAAQAMFKQLSLHDLSGNLITITNIPLYPVNNYTPAVHRVLQLAANIFDATTNGLNNYPTTFRPYFSLLGGTNVVISGYEMVNGPDDTVTPLLFLTAPVDFNDPSARLLVGTQTRLNAYGAPWIIGAKKGFPNFNQLAIQSFSLITRRLQVTKPSPGAPRSQFQTRQMLQLCISNVLGVEVWNSYSNNYPRAVYIQADGNLLMSLTNDANFPFPANASVGGGSLVPDMGAISFSAGQWQGKGAGSPNPSSFQRPLFTNVVFLPMSSYRQSPPGFIPVGSSNNNVLDFSMNAAGSYPQPHWGLSITNRIRCMIRDGGPNGRVVDYVQLNGLNAYRDLSQEALANDSDGVWTTSTGSYIGTTPMPMGMINQILIASRGKNSPSFDYSANQSAIDFGQGFMGSNKSAPGYSNLLWQVAFAPTAENYQSLSWQANDPLVHYTASDLYCSTVSNTMSIAPGEPFTSIADNLRKQNERYQPWGWKGGDQTTSTMMTLKDSAMASSDNWDFPANAFPNIGWLGRVHRGTPWQTVYLKASPVNLGDGGVWQKWTGDAMIQTNRSGNQLVVNPDWALNNPTRDRDLFSLFTTAVSESATRGQMSINQSGLAAWSAVLSGVIVLPNTTNNVIISPAGADTNSALWQIVNGANGINATRANTNLFRNQVFTRLGDILAVTNLTETSPFLSTNGAPINDEVIERIPQQIMSLLSLSHTPRFVVYAYGQTLKPADHSLVTFEPFFQLCTNYQVTAESASRAVVRVEGLPNNPHLVTESFNVLPPD